MRVRDRFSELQALDLKNKKVDWHIVDASKTIEEVQSDINEIALKIIQKVNDGKALSKMFDDGEYSLPSQTRHKENGEMN
jgi:hypothetical protein